MGVPAMIRWHVVLAVLLETAAGVALAGIYVAMVMVH